MHRVEKRDLVNDFVIKLLQIWLQFQNIPYMHIYIVSYIDKHLYIRVLRMLQESHSQIDRPDKL